MCGIVGVFRPDGGESAARRVRAMAKSLAHRGPDGCGVFSATDISIGHTRLAILDLTTRAAQPMTARNGRYVLSFNGEIYNFRELRAALSASGVAVESTGDTEVLLAHLTTYGLDRTVARLDGEWAFALWDAFDRRLVLARDRHGVKPLYYRTDGGEVRFASELKCLVDGNTVPDATSVNGMLLGLPGTGSSATLFAGIDVVGPGSYITFTSGSAPECSRFARLPDLFDGELRHALLRAGPPEIADRTHAVLQEGVRSRMVSDAPLACLLSGGLDSSLIAALAREHDPGLQLFHADVAGDSERGAAEAVARHLGLDLHVVPVSDADFIDNIAAVTLANDIPLIYHLNSVPFFLVSQLASTNGMKVVLTGEGSDEYFLGYPEYAQVRAREAVARVRRALRQTSMRLSSKATNLLLPVTERPWASDLADLMDRYDTRMLDDEIAEELRTRAGAHKPQLADAQTMKLVSGHLLSLLHRNDRLGMAWSLESRFPFLADEVARFAVNLPGRYKLRPSLRVHDAKHPFVTDKWCVRAVARRYLPDDFANRVKKGFPVSVHERIDIDPAVFRGGFVAEHFRLRDAALGELTATPKEWQLRLLLIDVWGRIFFSGESPADVTSLVRGHVAIG